MDGSAVRVLNFICRLYTDVAWRLFLASNRVYFQWIKIIINGIYVHLFCHIIIVIGGRCVGASVEARDDYDNFGLDTFLF